MVSYKHSAPRKLHAGFAIVVFGYGFDTEKFTHVFEGFFTAAGTLSPNPPEQYGLNKPTNSDHVKQRHFKAYKTVCVCTL